MWPFLQEDHNSYNRDAVTTNSQATPCLSHDLDLLENRYRKVRFQETTPERYQSFMYILAVLRNTIDTSIQIWPSICHKKA